GDTISKTNPITFGCEPVENAAGYQLLFGSDPDRVMDFIIVSDTLFPPHKTATDIPADRPWWTVRAYDQFGSTLYADPRLVKFPENHPPVADAGPDQILYAGLDRVVDVTLNGANSSDPDGNALHYTWAWEVDGHAYLTNGVSPTIQLPDGVHTVQLMVDDGE